MVEQMLRDKGWAEDRIDTVRHMFEALEAPPQRTRIITVTSTHPEAVPFIDVSGPPVAVDFIEVTGDPVAVDFIEVTN
jgi:hypothetical protein